MTFHIYHQVTFSSKKIWFYFCGTPPLARLKRPWKPYKKKSKKICTWHLIFIVEMNSTTCKNVIGKKKTSKKSEITNIRHFSQKARFPEKILKSQSLIYVMFQSLKIISMWKENSLKKWISSVSGYWIKILNYIFLFSNEGFP